MAIALVPRGVRALADQINAYYRLLTGAQPGSIILRLSGGGGKLEVRHSGTNAPVLTVTDSGATGTISAADGSVTNAKLAPDAVTTDKIKDNEIRNADIFTGAGILLSKLEGGTAGLVRSNGSVITSGNQVAAADLPTAASAVVDSARIVDLTIVNGDISATAGIVPSKLAAVTANQVLRDVGSGVVGGGLIRDANVDAAGTANIALNKLANVGANNIVKDVGLGVTGAGLLVDANVTNGTLTPAKLNAGGTGFRVLRTQDGVTAVWGQVVSNDITGGAPPPNGSGAPDAWKVYGTDAAGTTVQLRQVAGEMLASGVGTVRIGAAIGPLGAPQAFLDFNPIPTTYGVLRLYFQVRSVAAGASDSMFIVLNNLTTAIYYGERLFGTGSTAGATENTPGSTTGLVAIVPAAGATASWPGVGVIELPGYANTVLAKGWTSTSGLTWGVGAGNSQATYYVGLANIGAAVTQIRLGLSGGNFAAGSWAALYAM